MAPVIEKLSNNARDRIEPTKIGYKTPKNEQKFKKSANDPLSN